MERERSSLVHTLSLSFKNPAKLQDLIVGQVGTVALARDAQAFIKSVDDVVVGHAEFFGELVDAQHEGAYLGGFGELAERSSYYLFSKAFVHGVD
jgi:hypothetical protein